MAVCTAAMPSYTYAMKAEKLLKSRGYYCEIRRSEKNSRAGCGYSLFINGNCSEAVEILEKYSVPYTAVYDGGV